MDRMCYLWQWSTFDRSHPILWPIIPLVRLWRVKMSTSEFVCLFVLRCWYHCTFVQRPKSSFQLSVTCKYNSYKGRLRKVETQTVTESWSLTTIPYLTTHCPTGTVSSVVFGLPTLFFGTKWVNGTCINVLWVILGPWQIDDSIL